jgi:hypothetical protein
MKKRTIFKKEEWVWAGSHSSGYEEFYHLRYNPTESIEIQQKCSLEMSIDFQRTTRHYIPEERTLQIYLRQAE